MTRKHILEALKILLFVGIGIGIVFWFWRGLAEEDKRRFWESIEQANYIWLLVSLVIGALSHYIRAVRWGVLIETTGYNPKKYNLFFAVMNMYFFNMAVPRLGEVTRCVSLQSYEKVPFEKSFGTVISERAVDVIVLGLFFGLAFVVNWQEAKEIMSGILGMLNNAETPEEQSFWAKNLKFILLGGAIFVFAILYLLRNNSFIARIYGKIVHLLKGFWDGMKSVFYVKQPFAFTIQSILIWICYYLMTYVCFLSIPETAALGLNVALLVFCFGSVAIALVPGGIGIYPVFVSIVLASPALGGIDKGVGLALGWIIWTAQTVMILLLGTITLILQPIVNRKRHAKV